MSGPSGMAEACRDERQARGQGSAQVRKLAPGFSPQDRATLLADIAKINLQGNFRRMMVGDMVVTRVERRELSELKPPGPASVIVSNPPYGIRLGDATTLPALYRAIGDALKTRRTGCTAWLLVGDRKLAGAIGLRPQRRVVLFNGPIECRLLRFDLYAGRREAGSEADSPGSGSL